MERLAPEQEEIILVFDNVDNATLFTYWKEALWDFNNTKVEDEMYTTMEGIHHLLTEEMLDRGLTEYMVGERERLNKLNGTSNGKI